MPATMHRQAFAGASRRPGCTRAVVGPLAGALLVLAGPVAAQQPIPDPYSQPIQTPAAPAKPPPPSIRELFASTLAAVATAGGSALTVGLTQAISGGLTAWFNRKLKVEPNTAAPGYPPGYGSGQTPPYAAAQQPYPPAQQYPPAQDPYAQDPYAQDPYAQQGYPPQSTYPSPQDAGMQPAYPAQPDYGATQGYPPAQQYPAPAEVQPYPSPHATAQYYDAYSGATAEPDPAFAAAASDAGSDGLFAGLAFEVHAVNPGGASFPVDPSSHVFRTGDRFVVYFRTTLPGRMDIYNINPAGQQSLIDSSQIAAGQLARLGPYEFTAITGNEQLRLVLQPCSTPSLVAATRDIVRVAEPAEGPGLGLAGCGPVTRSASAPRTRDIRKVVLDGTTGFALDPVSQQEQSSGRLEAREVTIVFRHR